MTKLEYLSNPFTVKRVFHKISISIDRFKGLDFETVIRPENVGLDPLISYSSMPSGNQNLRKLFKGLEISTDDSILDIGCGKGSAMRIMLDFPFKTVEGIEISSEITKITKNNFKKLKAIKIKIHTCDATVFQHYFSFNYFYFFNPFPPQVMSKVIDSIKSTLIRNPREVFIIYNNPTCHEQVIEGGIFKKILEHPSGIGYQIYVYSNVESLHKQTKGY